MIRVIVRHVCPLPAGVLSFGCSIDYGGGMITPERMAELDGVLTLIEDQEQERQLRGQIEMERRRRERARKQPPRPAVEKSWIVTATLSAKPIATDPRT